MLTTFFTFFIDTLFSWRKKIIFPLTSKNSSWSCCRVRIDEVEMEATQVSLKTKYFFLGWPKFNNWTKSQMQILSTPTQIELSSSLKASMKVQKLQSNLLLGVQPKNFVIIFPWMWQAKSSLNGGFDKH